MKTITTVLLAAVIGLTSVTTASAGWKQRPGNHYQKQYNHNYKHGGNNHRPGKNKGWEPGPGAALAAGAILGLGIAAILAPRNQPSVGTPYYGAPPKHQPRPAYGSQWQAHVAYCKSKYRSYNPATDQYLGYDGYYHFCRAPY